MRLQQLSEQLLRQSYWLSSAPPAPQLPVLQGTQRADVCIVGGGLSGISAALELRRRGRSVVLLEAMQIGWGASGRNGGQAVPGFACGWSTLQRQLGTLATRELWQLSRTAVDLLRERIASHGIDCALRDGVLEVACSRRRRQLLQRSVETLQAQGLDATLQWLDAAQLAAQIGSARPLAGVLDSHAAHLHPLRYTRGLAAAARRAGAQMHEHSEALALHAGRSAGVQVRCAEGRVDCDAVLLAAGANLGRLAPSLARRQLPVASYQIATAPLPWPTVLRLLPGLAAVSDNEPDLNYFSISPDQRLLFGGCSSGSSAVSTQARSRLRRLMLDYFPQLDDCPITHCWGGLVDTSWNLAPDFGRLAPTVYYLQGYSGHGLAFSGLAGQLAAAAICGHSEGFDLVARLRHRGFPAPDGLRHPLLHIGLLWTRLREWL